MSLSIFANGDNIPTATGNQAYTGIGFTPKCTLLMSHVNTGFGEINGLRHGFGVGISSTERWACYGGEQHNAASSNTRCGLFEAKCLVSGSPTSQIQADFVSNDADGFTLNWTEVQGTSRRFGFVCLAGSALTVKAGTFTLNTSTGAQAVTGVGFQPDLMMFCGSIQSTSVDTEPDDMYWGIGFAVSSTSRGAVAMYGPDAQATMIEKCRQETDQCMFTIDNTSYLYSFDLDSMDSDGFTIDVTTAPAASVKVAYLAIGGVDAVIGTFDQSTSTGNQSVTGYGFQPEGTFLIGNSHVSGTGIVADANAMFGFGKDSSNHVSISSTSDDAAATSNCSSRVASGTFIMGASTTNADNTIAGFVSNDSDGITFNNTTVDATSRRFIYAGIKETVAAGGGQPMHNRRLQSKHMSTSQPSVLLR